MNEGWNFIEVSNEYIFCGVADDEKILDFKVYSRGYTEEYFQIGSIYRGRVLNKIKGLNAVFIDIGSEKMGFLQVDSKSFENYKVGDEVLVQLKNLGSRDKGPKLTDKLEIRLDNFIISFGDLRISFSKKIKDDNFKCKTKGLLDKIFGDLKVGFVIRTKAETNTLNELEQELLEAYGLVKYIFREKNFSPSPKLIFTYGKKILLDGLNEDLYTLTNDEGMYKWLKSKNFSQANYDKNFKLSAHRVYLDLVNLFSRKVVLDNGIELVFDQTEALTVIDVNSKGYLREGLVRSMEDANLDLIDDLVRQIHLRNISGIILIDFISTSRNNEENIIKKIKDISIQYSNPLQVIGFTKLGILETTRDKGGNNIPLLGLTTKDLLKNNTPL